MKEKINNVCINLGFSKLELFYDDCGLGLSQMRH